MNIYLEKIASWKSPSKFLGYVTGQTKREAGARVRHMEEAIANKHTLEGLQEAKNYAEKETTKARIVAGTGAATAVAGTAYGYKKIRDKQKQETSDRYAEIMKLASASAAKELGGSALSGVGKILRHVGRTTVDLMNTAGGGKIKNRGIMAGMQNHSKEYKEYVKAGPMGQVKAILKRTPGADRKQVINEQVELHKGRRNARIALTSVGAAGVSGYGWHKAREAMKKNNPNYYN